MHVGKIEEISLYLPVLRGQMNNSVVPDIKTSVESAVEKRNYED
jgi:hypothetical protein